MVGKIAMVVALIPLSLVWAQGESMQAVDPVSVSIKIMQDGDEVRREVEKDAEIQIIAEITVNVDTVNNLVAMLTLDLGEALDIDDVTVVRMIGVWEQDPATGDFKIQPRREPHHRIRFKAAQGDTGIHETRVVKWAATIRKSGKGAVLVRAVLTDPSNSRELAKAEGKKSIQVVAVLSLQQLWEDGGLFMWPLGFSLVLGIAFALERLLTLSLARINIHNFVDSIRAALKSGDVKGARKICEENRGPVAAVIGEGLLRADQGIPQVEKAIESAGAIEMAFLERGMVVLATVTTVAPLLGFLGTVWGMIAAFKAIAEAGDVQPSIVASGISQALITTAAGLVIAIIIQSFNNFLISRIDRLVIDMEETSTNVVDILIEAG